ncbi:MAG TPA: hypothetical protein VI385_02165 [Flavisolibacter sp.]
MDEHEVTKRLAAQHSIMETKISRKFIEEHAPFNQLKRWTALAILFVLTVIVIALLYLFRTTPGRIFVAKINANTAVQNFSKRYGFLLFEGEGTGDGQKFNCSQLAEEGDILSSSNCCFPFDPNRDSFELSDRGDSLTYIDGKLAGIQLTKSWNAEAWFKKINADSLRNLRSLFIESPISEASLSVLEGIAKYRKNLSINTGPSTDSINWSYNKDLVTISRLFTPGFLGLLVSKENVSVLNQFKSVKTLMLYLEDSNELQLPTLSNLRECILITSSKPAIGENLLKNNTKLEKLSIIAEDSLPMSANVVKNLPNLKELAINEEVFLDVDSLHKVAPGLTTLIIADTCKNITALSRFSNLKWLGLPATTKQKELDAILKALPHLEVLQMSGNDGIKSLGAINGLKDLKGLVIAHQLPDSSSLLNLKQLRYLSIPEQTDSAFRQKLAKTLPGCIIVPNGGACLGSGWLLLLIPFATIIIYFRRRIANDARQL